MNAAHDQYRWARLGEVTAKSIGLLADMTLISAGVLVSAPAAGAAMLVGIGYDKSKLVINAIYDGMDASQAVNMLADNHLLIAEHAIGGKVGTVVGVAKDLKNMVLDVAGWWQKSGRHAQGDAGIRSAKRTLRKQLEALRRKIQRVEALLAEIRFEQRRAVAEHGWASSTEGPVCAPSPLECRPDSREGPGAKPARRIEPADGVLEAPVCRW